MEVAAIFEMEVAAKYLNLELKARYLKWNIAIKTIDTIICKYLLLAK